MSRSFFEPCNRACGHDIDSQRIQFFIPALKHLCINPGLPTDFPQEFALPGVAVHQDEPGFRKPLCSDDCQHQPGESAAGSNISHLPRVLGNVLEQLGRIEDVATPDLSKCRRGDQSCSSIPFLQEPDKQFQIGHCFT